MDKNFIILCFIPIISALIGWITNWVAIKSLFRPYKPIKFLGFKFCGLIPKRKEKLAKNIAEVVSDYLFSHKDLMYEFKKEKNIEKIKERVIPIVRDRILDAVPPMFKSVAAPLIESVLLKESREIIIKIGDELFEHFEETMNVRELVEEKILNYETKNLEKIMYQVAKSEFKHIEILGAFIGFLVGCFQVGLFLLI